MCDVSITVVFSKLYKLINLSDSEYNHRGTCGIRGWYCFGSHTHNNSLHCPRDPVADVVPKFLQALKDLGDVDEEAISEAHLRSEYSQLQQQVYYGHLVGMWLL